MQTIEQSKPVSSGDQDLVELFAKAALNAHFPAVDQFGHPSLGRFLLEKGRLPFVEDEIKPWRYRGWLIPYIQLCEANPNVSSRYDYVIRTLDAGHLLDEPLPQCNFVSEGSVDAKAGTKMLADMVKIAEYRSGYARSIDLVCQRPGFALGVSQNPPEIADRDQEQLYRLFDISKWSSTIRPITSDSTWLELSVGQSAGFYPTPMCICTMMAMMTYANHDGRRTENVLDCAVGTGRLLLAASNYSLRLYGQDINSLCVLACKINMALFAPWFHIPESFYGDVKPVEVTEQGGELVPPEPEQPIFTTKIDQPSLFDLR